MIIVDESKQIVDKLSSVENWTWISDKNMK